METPGYIGPKMILHYGGEYHDPSGGCRNARADDGVVDLTDTTNLVYIVSSVQPTEIYNLAAQSHVKVSFDMAEYTVSYDSSAREDLGLME